MSKSKEKIMAEENQEAMAKQETRTEATAQPEAPQPQGNDLSISDLVALKSIVEVATSRGAFKATELEAVGKTFNKLNAFLEAVAKKEA
jgi:hypothetical protein